MQQAYELGRVDKYLIDLGWERNMHCYVLYGKSGGSKEAIATTEAILEAIEEEVEGDPILPTIVQGDFNATPSKLKAVKKDQRRKLLDRRWRSCPLVGKETRGADMPRKSNCEANKDRWSGV